MRISDWSSDVCSSDLGLGWGDAKEQLCRLIERDLGPMRDRYAELMARPDRIEDVLRAGAQKAHLLSGPFMARLRDAVGLAREQTGAASATAGKASARRARFVRFRDDQGAFRFRLLGSDRDEVLLFPPLTAAGRVGEEGGVTSSTRVAR